MGIIFNEKTKEFHLYNNNISYIMKILKNNHVGQLYFGKKIRHRQDFSNMNQTWSGRVDMSVNVCEDDMKFSLDVELQEYPSYGTGDFRQPAVQILQENGSRITDFQFRGYRILEGKPELEGLPATYAETETEAETLEIYLEDKLIDVELVLSYTIFRDYNAITKNVKIVNKGTEKFKILRALSLCQDFPDHNFEMMHLSGTWARERDVKLRKLEHGIQEVYSARGASSPHHNPFLALKRPEANEHRGEVYGFNFVYSGNFIAQVEVDHFDTARVLMGINPFDFSWLLGKDESFQTPEVVAVYSDKGLNGMSSVYHKLYRNRLCRGNWRDKERPVLINNWEATYFDFNEEKILEIAESAKELDIEMFVLDDGWFGERSDDDRGLGDWYVNRDKLPNGIDGLAAKINDMGMKFGLWFEPEMINKNSDLYREHPDWLIQIAGRSNSAGRNQHILDFSRKDVRDHIYNMMADILNKASVSYVKWDMNRNMSEIGSAMLPADKQQETVHRYILGLYEFLERLNREFPDILFESCASGGGRFDAGMLYYMPQTWTSDNTDAVERLKIQYGTSMAYPLSAMGAHVSAVPNHQVGRITSLDMRGSVAIFGAFGYELNVKEMTEEEKNIVKQQVAFYKENRQLIRTGDFYRILSPFENNETAWMVVSQDKTEAILAYFQVLGKPNPGFKTLKLFGLDEDKEYSVTENLIENSKTEKRTYFGDELIHSGYKFKHDIFGEKEHKSSEEGIRRLGDFKAKLIKFKDKNK